MSDGAGIGTPVHQAPDSGRAKGAEVSPVPTAPAPGESGGWGGHRACPRVRQPELGSSACDSPASRIGCRSGAQEPGIYPVTGEKKGRGTPWAFVLKSSIWKMTRQKGGFALKEDGREGVGVEKERREGRKEGVFSAQ